MTVKYYCSFPECSYETFERSRIDLHHILPKSLGGSNKPSNLLSLCSNCHRKIYIKEATKGFHSILHEDSIIILNKLGSSNGIVLSYIDCKDNLEKLYLIKEKRIL